MRTPSLSFNLFKILIVFFFLLTLFFNFRVWGEQQYSFLAQSFLQGKTYFIETPGYWYDAVLFGGKYYWALAPFPAIALMPFVWMFKLVGQMFPQGYLQFFLNAGVFLLSYRIARKFLFSLEDSLYLAFAFCFASVYQFVALVPWSWYFAQVITVAGVFLAIYLYLKRKSYWLIGLLLGAVLATRTSTGLGVLFFLAAIIFDKRTLISQKIFKAVSLLLPVFLSGVLLLAYNFVRFGNPLDNGFARANEGILTVSQRYEQINYGLFQLRNIPTNFYYYFIKTLDPVLINFQSMHGNTYILKPPFVQAGFPGTSFFVVSPIFLYVFRNRFKKSLAKYCLLPIGTILFLLMIYYWPGWRQVGPRYLLDLLPFGYLLLLFSFRNAKLSSMAKVIIVASSLFDLYLLFTVLPR